VTASSIRKTFMGFYKATGCTKRSHTVNFYIMQRSKDVVAFTTSTVGANNNAHIHLQTGERNNSKDCFIDKDWLCKSWPGNPRNF